MKYTLYKFHFLNGISEINQLFDDILIIWPAPVLPGDNMSIQQGQKKGVICGGFFVDPRLQTRHWDKSGINLP